VLADPIDERESPHRVVRVGNVDHDQVREDRRELPGGLLRGSDRRCEPSATVDEIDQLGAALSVRRHDQDVVEVPRVVVRRRGHGRQVRDGWIAHSRVDRPLDHPA
jgi:hypothetical protein